MGQHMYNLGLIKDIKIYKQLQIWKTTPEKPLMVLCTEENNNNTLYLDI